MVSFRKTAERDPMTSDKTITECITVLESARNTLHDTAIELLKADVAIKGSLVAKMLEESDKVEAMCKRVRSLTHSIAQISTSQHDHNDTLDSLRSSKTHGWEKEESDGNSPTFPYAFISDGLLYKVGQKEKTNPDGTRGTW